LIRVHAAIIANTSDPGASALRPEVGAEVLPIEVAPKTRCGFALLHFRPQIALTKPIAPISACFL
jgi:hypothetical protein